MVNSVNVYKEENLFLIIFKNLIVSFILALIITFGVSLLFGYKYMLVASGSMTPVIPVRSMVILAPTDYEDLELGDIVTYKSSGKGTINFTHRVVEFAENGNIITAGDANINSETGLPQRDGEIPKSRYVGKVVMNLYPVGLLVYFIKENLIQCIVMIMIVFFTYCFIS